MVKGVNKTVIEVNDTGSKVFEKIVLYISPEFSNLGTKQLSKAVSSLNINYDSTFKRVPIRRKWHRKRLMLFFASLLTVAVGVAVLVFVL